MNIQKVLFALVLVGAIFVLLSANLGSLRVMTVLGGSMSPALSPGDMIFVSKVSPDSIGKGDVITYMKEDAVVTHRVVETVKSGFIVQGDANEDPDAETVKPSQLVGKVQLSLPMAGHLMNFVRSKFGLLIFIILPGIVIMGTEIKRLFNYRKGSQAGTVSKSSIFMMVVISGLLILNIFGTSAFFSDIETSTGNFIVLERGACLFSNVTKYWTDTCFNRMDGPAYNSMFYLVYHSDTGKVSATNPGGFYIYINISNTPNITTLQITDEILGNILSSGDFRTKGGNSFQVALSSGEAITDKFTWSFDGTTLTASLKPGQKIKADKWIWAVLHIEYAIDSLTLDEATHLFPHLYTNQLTVTINGQIYHSGANLNAHVKMVGKDFGKYGYSFLDLMKAPEPPIPPVIESLAAVLDETNSTTELNGTDNSTVETNTTIEEPILNETVQENTTIDTNTTETGGNSTTETNATEPVLNETTEPIVNETITVYPMVAGYNVFLVPDAWATSAFQLAMDYPLILDIAYIDAENNTITYVANDSIESSFNITAGMTITINALEPFDIV